MVVVAGGVAVVAGALAGGACAAGELAAGELAAGVLEPAELPLPPSFTGVYEEPPATAPSSVQVLGAETHPTHR